MSVSNPDSWPSNFTLRIQIYLWYTPRAVTVTTRIITFLVGNPYKLLFATVTGRGVVPRYILRIRDFPQKSYDLGRWDVETTIIPSRFFGRGRGWVWILRVNGSQRRPILGRFVILAWNMFHPEVAPRIFGRKNAIKGISRCPKKWYPFPIRLPEASHKLPTIYGSGMGSFPEGGTIPRSTWKFP